MSKIKKLFKAIYLIAQHPYLLNKVLDDETVNREKVTQKYSLNKGLPTIDLLDLLPDFNETLNPYSFLEGCSPAIDIAILKALAKQYRNCDYLEIGTWRGESVANISFVAKHCVTINLPDVEMEQMGMSLEYIKLHRYFSKSIKNITHISANSKTYDFSTLNQKFDLIFIDGDHHYESVLNDTRKIFPLLKTENSVIVWHDYGNNSEDVRWDVLKAILDGTPADKRKNLYRISNSLCAIYTTQKINSSFTAYPSTPNKNFEIRINAKK